MHLAINYSLEASDLLQEDMIKIDIFKCPEWPKMIADAILKCPVAVHFNLCAGRDMSKDIDWDFVERLMLWTNTPHVNLHLETRSKDIQNLSIDTEDPYLSDFIANQMITELSLVVSRFGAEHVVAENVPYRSQGKVLYPSADPDLVKNVIEAAGCGFLLDIAHARISAENMGIDEIEYLNRLPVERLRELHFSGVHDLDGWLQDHLPAQVEDWQTLKWVLTQINRHEWPEPWLLALEYGGVGEKFAKRSDSQAIQQQVKHLRDILTLEPGSTVSLKN